MLIVASQEDRERADTGLGGLSKKVPAAGPRRGPQVPTGESDEGRGA